MPLSNVEIARAVFWELHPDGALPRHPETHEVATTFCLIAGGGQIRIIFETQSGQACGFLLHIGGSLIHIILVIAVIVLVARLLGIKI